MIRLDAMVRMTASTTFFRCVLPPDCTPPQKAFRNTKKEYQHEARNFNTWAAKAV